MKTDFKQNLMYFIDYFTNYHDMVASQNLNSVMYEVVNMLNQYRYYYNEEL